MNSSYKGAVLVIGLGGIVMAIWFSALLVQQNNLKDHLGQLEADLRETNIAFVNHGATVIEPLKVRITFLEARVDILTEKALADETFVDRDEELFLLAVKTLSYRCRDLGGDHPEQCMTGFWVYVPSLNDYCFVPADWYLQHKYNKEGAISDLCGG